MSKTKSEHTDLHHAGMRYTEFLTIISEGLSAKTYFEIGTNTGNSLKAVTCDAVCVDPNFQISQEILTGRRRAHFFQSTSDDFFAHYDLRTYFPIGPDLAFLDGLHLFEALLRDFINTERATHDQSVILLHDCLPLNERMAERDFRIVHTEPPETRDAWTGDVWKILPVLRKYRPDLHVNVLDCPPTGLVTCTNLDRYSNVLSRNYDTILEEFSEITLTEFGLAKLWRQFPMTHATISLKEQNKVISTLFKDKK